MKSNSHTRILHSVKDNNGNYAGILLHNSIKYININGVISKRYDYISIEKELSNYPIPNWTAKAHKVLLNDLESYFIIEILKK